MNDHSAAVALELQPVPTGPRLELRPLAVGDFDVYGLARGEARTAGTPATRGA